MSGGFRGGLRVMGVKWKKGWGGSGVRVGMFGGGRWMKGR